MKPRARPERIKIAMDAGASLQYRRGHAETGAGREQGEHGHFEPGAAADAIPPDGGGAGHNGLDHERTIAARHGRVAGAVQAGEVDGGRLSLDDCRRLLPVGHAVTNAELERVRDDLYALAEVAVDAALGAHLRQGQQRSAG